MPCPRESCSVGPHHLSRVGRTVTVRAGHAGPVIAKQTCATVDAAVALYRSTFQSLYARLRSQVRSRSWKCLTCHRDGSGPAPSVCPTCGSENDSACRSPQAHGPAEVTS